MGKHTRTAMERFLDNMPNEKTIKGCLEYKKLNSKGYGHFVHTNGKERYGPDAHRAAWQLFNGIIPPKLFVCHKCDNKKCVNIDHLYLGTAQDNCRDKLERKLANLRFGEKHGSAKLKEKQVIEIKKRLEEGFFDFEIARVYKVATATIYAIKNKLSWKHLTVD